MEKINLQVPSGSLELFYNYVQLVDENFKTKHLVADYADLLCKSPKTLINTFRKNDLPSPMEILHGRLTLESIKLLTETGKPIIEIARSLGYYDLDVFSRCFKTKTGLAPRSFRDRHQYQWRDYQEVITARVYATLAFPKSIEKGKR